jgi:hypothetical protein
MKKSAWFDLMILAIIIVAIIYLKWQTADPGIGPAEGVMAVLNLN